MPFIGIGLGHLEKLAPDMFYINYRHRDYGSGRIILREDTLEPVGRTVAIPSVYPREMWKPGHDVRGAACENSRGLGRISCPTGSQRSRHAVRTALGNVGTKSRPAERSTVAAREHVEAYYLEKGKVTREPDDLLLVGSHE